MKLEVKDILISVQRALLDKITPNLRSVCIVPDNNSLKVIFYFNEPPTEMEQELASLADTEIISDFPPPDYETSFEIITLSFPNKIPFKGFCVYSRYEPTQEHECGVTDYNLINLLKKKLPNFIPYWEKYLSVYGFDEGITIQMLPFIEYVVDVIKSKDESEIKRIFDLVEYLLCDGSDSVQTAIATGFLEGLLNRDPDEIKFIIFRQFLGKESIAHCRAWDKFTGVLTEGLRD